LASYVPLSLLHSLVLIAAIFLGLTAALIVLRRYLLPKCDRLHVTWGCGYTAPNARMQYSGSSFSHPMASVFRDLLRYLTREELPHDVFPKDGSLDTHCVDSVERGIFKVLTAAEHVVTRLLRRIREDTQFSFGLGLLALLLLVALVLMS
jgi:hypothetical protein